MINTPLLALALTLQHSYNKLNQSLWNKHGSFFKYIYSQKATMMALGTNHWKSQTNDENS